MDPRDYFDQRPSCLIETNWNQFSSILSHSEDVILMVGDRRSANRWNRKGRQPKNRQETRATSCAFLATGSDHVRIWCPSDRGRLVRLAGRLRPKRLADAR